MLITDHLRNPRGESSPENVRHPVRPSEPRVLIADDQQDVLEALRLLLKAVVLSSECLRGASRVFPPLKYAADSIYRNGGKRSTLKLTKSGSGYLGAITMGVQRS